MRLEVDSREFFEPKNLSESIIYRVKGNERFDEVKIGYTAMYGDYYFYHTADGRLNTKMSNFDKEGFSRAIKKVNENLKKYCPSLEQVDDPEKSKEWFLFQ